MTRRDIIIIAVLANIGVLALLFMLAFRTDEEKIDEHPEIAFTLESSSGTTLSSQPTEVELPRSEPLDEVDAVIEEVAAINITSLSDGNDEEANLPDIDTEPSASTSNESTTEEPTSNGKIVEVTVKRGDALEKIARANGTTVEAIKKVNKMPNDKLTIGQVLKVPVGKKSPAAPARAPAKPIASSEVQHYTIKNGDNPWKIAKQFHLKLDELLKLNNLDEDSARKLKPGDQIRVN